MPRKQRTAKQRRAEPSPTALWAMSDGFYGEPAELNRLELIVDSLRYPTNDFERNKRLWDEHKAGILTDWVNEYPGTRPSWWWIYDSPRMSEAEAKAHGWRGWFFVPTLPDRRRRMGGDGLADFETMNVVPCFRCGVPECWDTETLNPENPPAFESQASYLERHGLFMPGEKRRLRKQDYEDQVLGYSEITRRDAGDDFCGMRATGLHSANDSDGGMLDAGAMRDPVM